ncbi:MAG: endonuclease III [Myxococcaceae bacterium]|nr:endonuclease III [Myxococcaceae bacterium]
MASKKKQVSAPRPPSPKVKERAAQVVQRLSRAIPDPHVELHFENPWQLLVAVILSAQSTDRMVNSVMPKLLEKWPDARALAAAPQEEVEVVIKSTGFFRNKAKAIREMSRILVERFDGQVPKTMEEMLELPGVARKTANVVLGVAYKVAAGIPVDTHAMRVSQRLGLTRHTDPVKIEAALCALFPQREWTRMGHRFVLHGRHVCTARAPRCRQCPLNEICPSAMEEPEGTWQARADAEAREMESRAEPFHRAG